MNNLNRRGFAIALSLALFLVFFAGRWSDLLQSVPERGAEAYQKKQYEKALELYQEAQTRDPDSDTLSYNLGNTLYQLGRYQDAAGQYSRVLKKQVPGLGANALYNMGNTLFQMGRQGQNQEFLKNALEAYKQSIRQAPGDKDSKYNYELTRRFLKEQQQQQPQQNQKNQKKDQPNRDQQQPPPDKQQQRKQPPKAQNQPQQPPAEQKPDQQKEQPRAGKMSKEEADRILQAFLQQEKEMQQKENEKNRPAVETKGPDW